MKGGECLKTAFIRPMISVWRCRAFADSRIRQCLCLLLVRRSSPHNERYH